ncbi:hypothetical protein M2283_009937 [Streptomyces pseudovenezuelae]|uniref:Transposase IS204/IS1001/IS1096/IS1165 DDE domain-containing protein n=1 Tax=Streptomyces pseudovenezuelae TaxID=67350 RepID=A0ABT6M216_9ACTN|nr:hypothetical protein [Streptomyces pseudovenezuelae]
MDEHAWRHTRRADKFVTVIIDLTPVRDGTGPSRLLDMIEGRSKQVLKTWLKAQTPAFRDRIEIVVDELSRLVGRADQRSPAKRSFSGTAVPVASWTRTKVSTPISSPNLSLPSLRKKMLSP